MWPAYTGSIHQEQNTNQVHKVQKSMKPWTGMKYLFAYHTFIFWVEVLYKCYYVILVCYSTWLLYRCSFLGSIWKMKTIEYWYTLIFPLMYNLLCYEIKTGEDSLCFKIKIGENGIFKSYYSWHVCHVDIVDYLWPFIATTI